MKKVFRVLLLFLIFATCGIFTACTRDNYKYLKFEVSYSLDNDNWSIANDGVISLAYGDGKDNLLLTDDGSKLTGTLYLKVGVTGVKQKYIDKILIQNIGTGANTGSNLIPSGTMVDVNTVVPLSISLDSKTLNSDGDYINTTLKLTETTSSKTGQIGLDITPSLTDMEMNERYLPAVGVGGSTKLSTNFISFIPANTAQKNLTYSIESVGRYINTSDNTTIFDGVPYVGNDIDINGDVITVSNNYSVSSTNHIIKVKATSLDNSEISTTFDVYITPKNIQGLKPTITYANGVGFGINPTLYVNSANYSENSFRVDDKFAAGNIYFNNGVLTSVYGKKAVYKLNIYVDGQKYDITTAVDYHGIKVAIDDNGNYKISATDTDYAKYPQVSVEFRYELEGVSYTQNSNVATYTNTIKINKAKLATGITVGADYDEQSLKPVTLTGKPDNDSLSLDIYSTNNKLFVTLNAFPEDVSNKDFATFFLSNFTGLNILGMNENNTVYNGQSLAISFDESNNALSNAKITVRLRSNPSSFNGVDDIIGEYITINLNLNYVVTADEVFAYADENCNISINDKTLLGNSFNISADVDNYLYLKVVHKNNNLDYSTISLTSSNNKITFDGNNATSLALNDASVIAQQVTGGTLFKIPLYATENGLNGIISVIVADGKVVLPSTSDTTIAVSSKNLVEDVESVKVNIDSSNTTTSAIEIGKDKVDNNHQNFAVIKNSNQTFRIVDSNNLKDINIKSINTNLNLGFGANCITNPNFVGNFFSFNTILNGTQILNVQVEYYTLINGVIMLQTKTLIVEFAVYTPIASVKYDVVNPSIGYLDNYEEGSTAYINYRASNIDEVTKTIYFSKTTSEGNIKVAVNDISNISAVVGLNDFILGDNEYTDIAGVILTNEAIDNYSGKVKVQITGMEAFEKPNVTIALLVSRLGTISDRTTLVTINFKTYKQADRVVVYGDSIDNSVIGANYLYLSTLTNDLMSAEFFAKAEWDDIDNTGMLTFGELGYQLYKYSQNDDGSIVTNNGEAVLLPYNLSAINVQINKDGKVNVSAFDEIGGLFKLVIGTMDSCTIVNNVKKFKTFTEVTISISDGSKINPYNITNAEELKALNNSDKHFVLANDITVDMRSKDDNDFAFKPITNFTGSLTGTKQIVINDVVTTRTYAISAYIDVNNSIKVGTENYVGLFDELLENSSIANLDIFVEFVGETNENSYIGAVAGKNNGKIINVNITVANSEILLNGNEFYIGSYVGDNNGTINLTNATLMQNSFIIRSAATQNYIGGVAGANNGLISSNYLGVDSLNSIDYSAIVNTNVINLSKGTFNANYYVGGIAGVSSSSIENVIVGGSLLVQENTVNKNASAYVGGIAGLVNSNEDSVLTSAVLGLNIIADTNNSTVAGLIGFAENAKIENSRVIIATAKYSNIGSVSTHIEGKFASGIVGDTSGTGLVTVSYSTVESFVSVYENHNIIVGENVAGVSLGNVVVNNSFVYTNLNAKNSVTVLSNGDINNSYYIGRINSVSSEKDFEVSILNTNNTNIQNTYGMVLFDDGYYSVFEGKKYVLKTEQLEKTLVNHDELFTQDTSVSSSTDFSANTYYIKVDDGYQRATVYETGIDYFTLNNNFRQIANYVLKENDVLETNNSSYSANNIYYNIDSTKFNYTIYSGIDGAIVEDKSNFNLNIDYTVAYMSDGISESFTKTMLLDRLLPNVIYSGYVDSTYNDVWEINSSRNKVEIGKISIALPYLLTNRQPLMILSPSDIKVAVNQDYVKEINSTYIDANAGFNPDNYDVAQTVLVNYFEGDVKANTHRLIPSYDNLGNIAESGLLSIDVLPSNVSGGVAFEVVRAEGLAYDCAEIDGSKIRFIGTSNGKPILVKIYSLFNPDLVRYAIFFTEYGATSLIPENDYLYAGEEDVDYVLDLFALQDEVASRQLINFDTANIYKGRAYKSVIKNGNEAIKNCLEIEASTESGFTIEQHSNRLGVYIGLDKDSYDKDADNTITFTLKLNATKYFGASYFKQEEGDVYITLASTSVFVNVHKSAEEVTVEQSALSGKTDTRFPINAKLKTSYVESGAVDGKIETVDVTSAGNTFIMNTKLTDGLNIGLACADGYENQLNALLNRTNCEYITDLFNISVISTYIAGFGYKYNIVLELKQGFEYRYIERNLQLVITLSAQTNDLINKVVTLTLIPTNLRDVELQNYSASRIDIANNYQSLITSSAETSIITPGGLGGVMIANVIPSFADVNEIRIISGRLFVPTLNRNVYIRFEQLVYDNNTNSYRSIAGSNLIYDGNGNIIGLNLQKVSEVKAGDSTPVYNGKIYIHTMLDSFSGLEAQIDVSLQVKTASGGDRWIERNKTLTTQYTPGAGLSFAGEATNNGAYLIQKNSANNIVTVSLDGYTYNPNPSLTLEWVKYIKDEKDRWQWVQLTDEEKALIDQPSNYISIVKDFDNVTVDANGTHHLPIKVVVSGNLPYAFRLNAKLSLTSSNESETRSMIFVPTDYILKDARINNLVGGRLPVAINENKSIDLILNTTSGNDYSDLLNNLLVNSLVKQNEDGTENFEDFFEIFTINDNQLSIYSEYFETKIYNNKLTLLGKLNLPTVTVNVNIGYRYEPEIKDGAIVGYKLVFDPDGGKTLITRFNLYVHDNSTEEVPHPIYTVDELKAMSAGENYILMNDLEITDHNPISTPIASLDGNNRVIYIKNFVQNEENKYGLFANLGSYTDENGVAQKSILKNVIVAFGDKNDINIDKEFNLSLLNNNITDIVFGGLVAQNEGGLIYNSEVINLANVKTFNIFVGNNESATSITFGGLVGINNGIITNSRVGRNYYQSVRVNSNGITQETMLSNFKPLTFSIGNYSEQDTNLFTAIAGGFVGINKTEGIIASSYIANTSLISYSMEHTTHNSRTAGFVANNAGTINYSYVKALENSINASQAYATGAGVTNLGNGSVAGFVHLNSGNISNSFANTVVTSNSEFVSGFVFENTGLISESYAASTLNSGDTNSSAEQPFVGVDDKNDVLSNGTLTNTYYYDPYSNINQKETDKPKATALNTKNIQLSDNLHGFVFIESNSAIERNQGVWAYYMPDSYEKHILPELNSANIVAVSYRYLLPSGDAFANAAGYALGSAKNPNIIRSAEEFVTVLTANKTSSSYVGYTRLINNIDLTNADVATRTNYTLGGVNAITSFEGNGMNIEGIFLDVLSPNTNKIGLFAAIENAYIKNLKLNFATGKYSTMLAPYSGGLAGTISNSVISNIELDGAGTTIIGRNFAGGLAGLIDGASIITGVSTNLNVRVDQTSTRNHYMYYNEQAYTTMRQLGYYSAQYSNYLKELSYAGGLAGVIDITKRTNSTKYNLSYINIYGENMNTEDEYNIIGDFVGGVAGYAGNGVNALKLKYHVGETDAIYGRYAAGGLFGVSVGIVTASQVTANEDLQFNYDKEISKYIIKLNTDGSADFDASIKNENEESKHMNLNLITSTNYAGGLVGMSIVGTINSCYSRAGLTGSVMGGMAGLSVGASVLYSYAVPYVNLNNNYTYVGGLIGRAFGIGGNYTTTDEVKEFADYAKYVIQDKTKNGTILQNTFSTLLIDVNAENKASGQIDLIVADCSNTSNGALSIADPIIGVYAGKFDSYENKGYSISFKLAGKASSKLLEEIYNLNDVNHTEVYSDIFSSWNNGFWSLDTRKFFPLLTEDEAVNYEPIYTADDFGKIIANPDGNFEVMDNIDMTGYTNNTNYVLPITFTGRLVGNTKDGDKEISNIQINATQEDNSGFFKETRNAQISNLKFIYGKSIQEGVDPTDNDNGVNVSNTVGVFGGLSATDDGSTITNVFVYSASDKISLLKTISDGSISGFGGILGNATNSTISRCSYAGNVDATLQTIANGTQVNVGGLVASGEAKLANEDENSNEVVATNFTLNGGSVGTAKTVFNLALNNSGANIGGAIGNVSQASVSSNIVGQNNVNVVEFNIVCNNSTSLNYGGFAGISNSTNFNANIAKTKVVLSGNGSNNTATYVAGFIGYVDDVDTSKVISGAEVKINVNAYEYSCNEFVAAVGVANGANVTIYQSAFAGNFNNEIAAQQSIESSQGILNNIVAGAAIGIVSGNSILSEVVTDAVFTLGGSGANTITLGGLVGKVKKDAELYIDNCIAAGRLVPYGMASNSGTSANENRLILGGLIGFGGDNNNKIVLNIQHTISLVSILTDGINDSMLPYFTKINAVFGSLETKNNAELKNVFYSSDYAMFAEKKDNSKNGEKNLVNLNAYRLTHADGDGTASNSWKAPFVNGSSEVSWTVKSNSLPYPTSLRDSLYNLGILELASNVYGYKLGTAFNPEAINVSSIAEINLDSYQDYRYFVLASSINNNQSCKAKFTGTLNGILLGCDQIVNNVSLNTISIKIEDVLTSYAGFIPAVAKHSAISNLHIVLSGDQAFNSGLNGVITGFNQGVISNCSINGAGIKIMDEGNATKLGLIVGENNGIVSNCYSTAEILSTELAISGIVYNSNSGKVLSNYFTGYINNNGDNDNNKSAGIIGAYNDGVVYNNYMAGIVETVSSSGNSFVGTASKFGENNKDNKNFIDKWANSEPNNESYAIKIVDTQNLLNRQNFDGNWHSTMVDEHLSNATHSYGYNYNYPIYKFNKRDGNFNINDIQYSTYTGKGYDELNEVATDINELLNEQNIKNNYYTHAFKIPHFGVLSSLNNFSSTLKEKTLNYVIIYDLDGKYKNKDQEIAENLVWTSIGTDSKFSGIVVSNKYFNFTPISGNEKEKYICTISNYNGSSLFTNITNSQFGFIKFDDYIGIANGGALGNTIQASTTQDDGTINYNVVKVTNVIFGDICRIGNETGVNDSSIGGLFGTINNGATVEIENLTTPGGNNGTSFTDSNRLIISSKNKAGLIAHTNNGTISFINEEETKQFVQFNSLSDQNSIFGGLVGENSGSISATDSVTIEVSMTGNVNASAVGGIVGEVKEGKTSKVSNIQVQFSDNTNINVKATRVGGLVAINGGHSTFENCAIASETDISSIIINNNKYFGVLAAHNSGNLKVTASHWQNIVVTATNSAVNNAKDGKEAIGGLIGANESGNLYFGINNQITIHLSVTNIDNVGGIVGSYNKGQIHISTKDDQTTPIKIEISSNGNNVGGAFGCVESDITKDEDKSTNEITISSVYNDITFVSEQNIVNSWRFLNSKKFADIEIRYGSSNNIGGLIGLFKAENLNYLMNNNTIKYADSTSSSQEGFAANIGGVVGTVLAGCEIANLSNNAGVGGSASTGYYGDTEITYTTTGNKKHLITINVGGLIGKVDENITDDNKPEVKESLISNMRNSGQIVGYQNVGGLVGYICSNTILGNIPKDGEAETSKASTGLSSTDVVINYNDKNTGIVCGIINVGGLVGIVQKNATIQFSENLGDVYGNADVGGLIGYNNNGAVANCKLGDDVAVNVKGIVYISEEKKTSSVSNQEVTYAKYVPTNLGGLVGFSNNGSVDNVKIYGVNVISAPESTQVISTISNYVAQPVVDEDVINDYNGVDENDSTNRFKCIPVKLNSNTKKVEFNKMQSGFGGVIGGAFGGTVVTNITLAKLTINSEYGINVGTLFGYYKVNNNVEFDCGKIIGGIELLDNIPQETEPDVKADRATQNISIDGAYNIGGIIGYLDNDVSATISDQDVKGNVSITLQSKLTGVYVGGLVGKMKGAPSGAIDNLTISNTGKIKIDTSHSFYMGGLVGRYEVDKSLTFKGKVDGKVTTSGITEISSISDFGGLIGMLKIGVDAGGINGINITGSHQYAFTVNTVENSNYYDGKTETSSSLSKDEKTVYLIAMAYYINQDSFSISATSGDWYDTKYTNEYGAVVNNARKDGKPMHSNPLNSGAEGWVKEYTMFKTMQRNIPRSENVGADWDSIAVVYDATYVTGVATIANQGLDNSNWLQWGSEDSADKTGAESDYDYICYTIYEETDSMPKLYSRVGVASPFRDEDLNFDTPIDSTGLNGWNKFGAIIGVTELKSNQYYIDLNDEENRTQGLTYLRWKTSENEDKGKYVTIGNKEGEKSEVTMTSTGSDAEQASELVDLSFFAKTEYYGDKVKYKNNKGVYFIFGTIFNNSSFGATTDEALPANGSIFNVKGMQTTEGEMAINKANKNSWIIKIAALVSILSWVIPGGKALKGIKAVGKLAKIAAKVVKVASTVIGKTIKIIATFTLVGRYLQGVVVVQTMVDRQYFTRRDLSNGFITSTYNRTVSYTINEKGMSMDYDLGSGDYKFFADYPYLYYTSTRPADYYEKYYHAVKKEIYGTENETEATKEFKKSEIDVSKLTVMDDATDKRTYYLYEDNGVEYYLYNTYVYNNGVYYIASTVADIRYMPTQLEFDTKEYSEYGDYIDNSGLNYVRGAAEYYNGKYSYTLPKEHNVSNNLYVENGNIKSKEIENFEWNNFVDFEAKLPTKFIPVTENYLLNKGYHKENERDLFMIRGLSGKRIYYDGYSVMQKAYYTAGGSQGIKVLDVGEEKDAIKTALFTKAGKVNESATPNGKINVDYIIANCVTINEDGVTIIEPYFYTINSIDTFNDTSAVDVGTDITGVLDEIHIKLYPTTFNNPYNSNIGDSACDKLYYLSEHLLESLEATGINHDVTYYYYDGGYKTIRDDENQIIAVATKIEDYTIIDDNGEKMNFYDSAKIDLYDPSGVLIKPEISLYDLVKDLNGAGNYRKYYLSYDAEAKQLSDKVEDYYITEGDVLFMRTNSPLTIQDGILQRYDIVKPEGSEDNYNTNKYLSNQMYGIYTRYKFDTTNFSNGNWNDGYKLFAKGRMLPNSATTYLVESACVTLGAGGTVNTGNTNNAKVGTISTL